MKKWLDKYEQGGMVLKQKTTDNYFKKPNPNEAEVSTPPGYVGLGYDITGRDYSPAWGGQFAMGGSLPGAVGFTYARTGDIPSNGKYAKKTKASAQKGKSLFKAPDVPAYAQGRESTAIEQPIIPLSDVDISRNKFRNEALRAKDSKSFTLNPVKLLARQELSDLGENIDPFEYGNKEGSPFKRIFRSGIFGSKEQGRKDLEAAVKNKPSDVNDSFVDEGKTRTDLLQLYSRRPQQYNTLEPADYIPTAGHERGDEYIKSKFVEDALIKSILNQSDATQPIPNLRTKADIQRYIETHGETALDTKPGAKTRGIATKVPALGTATLSAGEDNGRPYLSYYDLWDLNPYVGAYSDTPEKEQQNWHNQWKKEGVDIATKFSGAKPPKVYGRIYFDPETGRPIQKEDGGEIPQAQNGQEMSYYQHGLDFKTRGMKQGGVVKDDNGYLDPDNYGKVVEIDSPYITMEGVDEPLIGISDEGDQKYMLPGKNYKFKGKKVREYPVAKNGVRQEQKGLLNLDQLTNFTNYNKPQPGGWLDKY